MLDIIWSHGMFLIRDFKRTSSRRMTFTRVRLLTIHAVFSRNVRWGSLEKKLTCKRNDKINVIYLPLVKEEKTPLSVFGKRGRRTSINNCQERVPRATSYVATLRRLVKITTGAEISRHTKKRLKLANFGGASVNPTFFNNYMKKKTITRAATKRNRTCSRETRASAHVTLWNLLQRSK